MMFLKLKSNVRQLIRGSSYTYRMYLYLTNGYSYKLPNRNTDLHVTGYQRSGNTFAAKITKSLFPDNNIVTHIHSTSSIRLALKYNIPVVVLIREPRDAILSSIVKRVDGNSDELSTAVQYDLDEYYSYYSYVLTNADKLDILDFQRLINNPDKLVYLISSTLSLNVPPIDEIKHVVKSVYDDLANDKRQDGDRNMKSAYKEYKKEEYSKYIKNCELLTMCENIYEKLKIKSY